MDSLSLPVLGPFGASLDGQLLGRFLTRPVQVLLFFLACRLRLLDPVSAAAGQITDQVKKSQLRHKNDQHWS